MNKEEDVSSYIGSYHDLPSYQTGLFCERPYRSGIRPYRPEVVESETEEISEDKLLFLPLKEINVDVKIIDSIVTFKIIQVYVNPSN